jgi:hypothetical protein
MSGGLPVYTEKGVEALAHEMDARGFRAAAYSLRVMLRQVQATPSRRLSAPVHKHGAPWFREGSMA